MSEQDNIRAAEEWIEALTTYDLDKLNALRAPNYILEHPGFPGPVGAEEEDTHLKGLAKRLPGWRWKTEHLIAHEDFVVRNGYRIGTHHGPMTDDSTSLGMSYSDRELVLRISNTLQFENGKVVRSFVYYDRLSLLKQLDLIVPGL